MIVPEDSRQKAHVSFLERSVIWNRWGNPNRFGDPIQGMLYHGGSPESNIKFLSVRNLNYPKSQAMSNIFLTSLRTNP